MLEAFTTLSEQLARAKAPETVVALVAGAVTELFEPDALAITLKDDEAGRLTLAYRGGASSDDPSHPLLTLALRDGPLVLPANVADELRERGLGPIEPLHRSWVGAPLVSAGRIIGAISVSASRDGRFGEPARTLLASLAAQCAIALESARLFQLLSVGKREWEQTVDAITQAICVVDAVGSVRRANRLFAKLVDVPVTEITGRPWLSLLPPAWADQVGDLLNDLSATAVEVRAADRIFTVTARSLGPGVAVLVFEDLTEKKRLQDQLIQSEKMSAIGQLLAGVAHDLNNPLASVVGFADYLNEAAAVPPVLKEPLAVIQQEAERAANIVRNLLNFARRHEGARRPVAIRTLLARTLALLRNQLMATRAETALVLEPDLPEIEVDTSQIQQVLVNLINNAAQALASTGNAGHITITAKRWLDGIAIQVADDGPGVPPELSERIFEPFFTTKPEGEGTGLGLSICQGIVREHGGRITVESAPGIGTTFTVELPAAQGTAPSAAEERGGATPVRPLSVLVVDDEPHILHYMRATLESWGHTVALAADGAEALAMAQAQPFDLILCDLRMPRLGGREFYAALTHLDPALAEHVIFSTGDTVRDDAMKFLAGLGRPHLNKPFKLAELRQLLDRVGQRPLSAGSRTSPA